MFIAGVAIEIELATRELDGQLLEKLLHCGVADVRPLFPRPARGWRDEAAARRAKLDRFYVAEWSREIGDGTAAAGSAAEAAAAIARLPGIAQALVAPTATATSTTPNDPDFASQWSLQAGFLNAETAWDKVKTSSAIVAIIDCGCDLTHPELSGGIWVNPGEIPGNGIDDEGNGFIDDVNGWDFYNNDDTIEDVVGHGSKVSGVAGAATDNATQVAGVCWGATLMQAKVWHDQPLLFDVLIGAAGLVYAADNGARVAQMAWGSIFPDPTLKAAVDYAESLDVVMVSVPGNRSSTQIMYPAAWPSCLGVISTDVNDLRAPTSSYGTWNDLSAPGEDVYVIAFKNQSRTASGTTFASAHVSGAAALLRAANATLDATAVRLVLEQSAVDLGAPGLDADFAWGRLDLNAAVDLATTLTATPASVPPGSAVTISIDAPNSPGFIHALFVSRFGREPGIPLSSFDPNDARFLALNYDALLMPLEITLPNGGGIFDQFLGVLDGNGHDQATLHVPRGPALSGSPLDFAALLFDPANLSQVAGLTATGHVEVQ
jgi:subtilisin family serine protease